MNNLNQIQKDLLNTVTNRKLSKRIKKQFKAVNTEHVELNQIQRDFLSSIDSESLKRQLMAQFKKANHKLN